MKRILLLLSICCFALCCENQTQKIAKAYSEMELQIDSLSFPSAILKYKSGSETLDSLTFTTPVRIRYVYNDVSNSGFSVYKINKDGMEQIPFILATESETNVIYLTERWDNVTLKIITSGAWAMSFEEYGTDFSPKLSFEIDTTTFTFVKDSLLNTQFKSFQAADSLVTYDDLIQLTQYWRIIDHRRGTGEFETDWFYLPACKVRIESFFDPVPYSDGCCISLEGKGKTQSYYGMNIGGYSWKSTHSSDKTFSVPAGQYFIYADADGVWEYKVSVCY
ncbi:MAG: hypothetical protein KBT00_03325 [Bacteroidales bacterium]|nr:hypothetical protein [Candidatus Cacconaster merdequi]